MVIISDYKSDDFYLKGYHIEYTSPKIRYCPIELDIDSINKDTKYTYCTPLIAATPTIKILFKYNCRNCNSYFNNADTWSTFQCFNKTYTNNKSNNCTINSNIVYHWNTNAYCKIFIQKLNGIVQRICDVSIETI